MLIRSHDDPTPAAPAVPATPPATPPGLTPPGASVRLTYIGATRACVVEPPRPDADATIAQRFPEMPDISSFDGVLKRAVAAVGEAGASPVSAVIVRNSRHSQAPPPPPRRDDQMLYAYAMFYDGWKYIAYADSAVGLLDALLPGYAYQDEQWRLEARIRLAIAARVLTQAMINAGTDPAVMNTLTAEERSVLTDRGFAQPQVDVWQPAVPLVLVESGYAPYTDIERPISGIADVRNPPNIIWLRPADDWEFLESLATAGFIGLTEATEP
jgi:hypothetical protein